jgi:hypothetical protein
VELLQPDLIVRPPTPYARVSVGVEWNR